MTAPRGEQLQDFSIPNTKLYVGVLSADATGRALIAANFFDLATVNSAFQNASIADGKLASVFIKQNGTVAFTADQSMGGNRLTNVGAPVSATDAVNKNYADALVTGFDPKESCRAGTTADLDATRVGMVLTANNNGALVVDGVTMAVNDRLLVKNQTTGADNGIYVVTDTGDGSNPFILTRAYDFDQLDDQSNSLPSEVTAGAYTWVTEGTTWADTGWILSTDDPITINTTALTFTQFSSGVAYTFSDGLTVTGNVVKVLAANGSISVGAGGIQVVYGSIVAADAGANVNGVAVTAARSDHKHQVSTAAPTVTVKSEATAAGAGTATTLLRSDAQLQAATATPGTNILSDASTAQQGTASTLLRSDARLLATTATAVSLGSANAQGSSTALARADHVHKGIVPTSANKQMAVNSTANADFQEASPTTIAFTPALGGYVDVRVNGISYEVGDGVKTTDTYFSSDGGTTAKTIATIAAGDKLYWNKTQTLFRLDSAKDTLDFHYLV